LLTDIWDARSFVCVAHSHVDSSASLVQSLAMKLSDRSRRWLVTLGVLVCLYAVLGFFVAPMIVSSVLLKQTAELTGRQASVGKVRINPFAVSVTIEDFRLSEKSGNGTFVAWKRFYANAGVLNSLFGAWVASDIELEGFSANVELDKAGTFNFADILAKLQAMPKAPAQAEPKPMRPMLVKRLVVKEARLDFSDQSLKTPFKSIVGPMSFKLDGFRTAGPNSAPGSFEAVTEAGERFSWQGTVSAEQLASNGRFGAAGLVLKKYLPYMEPLTKVVLEDGILSVEGSYDVSFKPGASVMRINKLGLVLEKLRALEQSSGPVLLELPKLEVKGVDADALTLKASVEAVSVNGGVLHVRREKDGALNLLNLVVPPPATPGAQVTPPLPAMPTPDLLLQRLSVADFSVEVSDLTGANPAHLSLSKMQVGMSDLSLAPGARMPLQASFAWAPAGTVKVEGVCMLKPEPGAELIAEVKGLDLRPVTPLIEQFVNARLSSGSVTTAVRLAASLGSAGPSIAVNGDVTVDNLTLIDTAFQDRLAGFTSLSLKGLRATTTPKLSLSLEELSVVSPFADVRVQKDGSINLLGLTKSTPQAPATKTEAPAESQAPAQTPKVELPEVQVAKVSITDGNFLFADSSLEPKVATQLNKFSGSIEGLSSKNMARADVALSGRVDDSGSVSIKGKLDPLGPTPFVELKIDVSNVDLLPLSPYSGKFAGYELARGQLNVDTKINVQGTRLDSTHVVTLNQFTFGAPVESKSATKLPVRLGIALLKDMDGKIEIDMPIEGNLTDPSFRIGRVVGRVITNLLTKAAVSPFALLGSMFGGGGEELSFQEFDAGSAQLLERERAKMETLVKALVNRPGLSLAIEGAFDTAADAQALRLQQLEALVRSRLWDEQRALNPSLPPLAEMTFTPEQQAAMLAKLYQEKFPEGAVAAQTPVAPAQQAQTPTEPQTRPGLIKRVMITLGFASAPGATAAAPTPAPAAASATSAAEGATQMPSAAEMTTRLAAGFEVSNDALAALASHRAQAVRDHLATTGGIDPARLFLSKSQSADAKKSGPRVFLSLQ